MVVVNNNKNIKTRNNTIESNNTCKTGNTGMESLEQNNMFSTDFDQILEQNKRALNHEHKINQQLSLIRQEKQKYKELRAKVKNEMKSLDKKKKDILKQEHNISRREKILKNNETQIQILHNQYQDLLRDQGQANSSQNSNRDIMMKLDKIKFMLDFIILQRQIESKSSSQLLQPYEIPDFSSLNPSIGNNNHNQQMSTQSSLMNVNQTFIDQFQSMYEQINSSMQNMQT